MLTRNTINNSDVTFKLYYEDKNLSKREWNDESASVIDLSLQGTDTKISGTINENRLPGPCQELQMQLYETTDATLRGRNFEHVINEREATSFTCSPAMAKTMRITARCFTTYENRHNATMHPNGTITYELRAHRTDHSVSIEQMPDFQPGELYGIHVVQVNPAHKGVNKFNATFELETQIIYSADALRNYKAFLDETFELYTPLTTSVQEALKRRGKTPSDEEVLKEVFAHLTKAWATKISLLDCISFKKEAMDNDFIGQLGFGHAMLNSWIATALCGLIPAKAQAMVQEDLKKRRYRQAFDFIDSLDDLEVQKICLLTIVGTCIDNECYDHAAEALFKLPNDTPEKKELEALYQQLIKPADLSSSSEDEVETSASSEEEERVGERPGSVCKRG